MDKGATVFLSRASCEEPGEKFPGQRTHTEPKESISPLFVYTTSLLYTLTRVCYCPVRFLSFSVRRKTSQVSARGDRTRGAGVQRSPLFLYTLEQYIVGSRQKGDSPSGAHEPQRASESEIDGRIERGHRPVHVECRGKVGHVVTSRKIKMAARARE